METDLPIFILLPVPWWHWFSEVQSLCHVQLFVTPQSAAHQASLSTTDSQSLL